uniref:Bardet-Biedl syndrome 10 n=1 Tax=Seriola dumerili TaxID=41447 RepID=A0A3B4UHM6_SERDU
MLSSFHFHLKHVLQAVCGLEAVVLRSFGPEGGQVLFTRDTGQAMLSRSGTRILTALRLEHPLARMVVECVWKHSTVTGDGSKTFILLLASLLRMIHTMACKEPNVSHSYNSREAAEAATARCLADELLAFALEEMDDLIAIGVVPYGFCDLWEGFTAETQSPAHTNNHGVQKLLASFFHTRLGQIHCDYISNLACQLLRHLKFKKDQPFLALQFVNDNFPALHTPVSGFPISCSRLIEGQVIHRDFAMPCPRTDQQPVKAVVFTGYLQPQLFSAGDVLEVGCGNHMIEENSRKEKSIVEFSAWSERSLECVIANLQSLGVSVLLSAVKQSAAVMALAAQAEMWVVECISEDELSLFAQLSGTTPVSDCWIIEPVNVATLTFCRPILLGVHRYDSKLLFFNHIYKSYIYIYMYRVTKIHIVCKEIHMNTSQDFDLYVHVAFHDLEERVMVRPSSLVICGPGEGQTDQYACAFQDAIRMLLTTCKPVGMTAATISKRTLQSQRSTSLHTDDRSNKIAYNSFQQRVLVPSCVIPAGGTFEFLLNHALLHHGRSSSVSDSTNIPAVSQLLANVLLSVPRQIYSHSPRHFLQIQSRGHGTSEIPLKDVFMLDLGLESVSCKYELLLAVLQCVTSLLRVDTVLCTHTALHTQSRRLTNISWEGTEDEAED